MAKRIEVLHREPDTEREEQEQEQQLEGSAKRGFLREHPLAAVIGAMVLVASLVGGYMVWQYMQTYQSTDDAQIDGHLNMVSMRVPGTVTAVYVQENVRVEAGTPLVQLDATEYRIAVSRAEANLAQARAALQAANPAVPITQATSETAISGIESELASAQAGISAAEREHRADLARVRQAEANNAQAEADLARYQMLVEKDEVSRQEYDQRVAAAKSSAAQVDAMRAAAAASDRLVEQRRALVAQARSRLEQTQRTAPQQLAIGRADVASRQATVEAAEAALAQARLDLEHTRLLAPISGVVGRKAVEVGMRVQQGQQLLSIVQLDDIWVTANFKETQLKAIHPGQRATIQVDAFEKEYEGYVESFPPATSAKYSILPPENASGNFVKVVQRLPVRIRFKAGQDTEHRLRPGMSVVPKVWIK